MGAGGDPRAEWVVGAVAGALGGAGDPGLLADLAGEKGAGALRAFLEDASVGLFRASRAPRGGPLLECSNAAAPGSGAAAAGAGVVHATVAKVRAGRLEEGDFPGGVVVGSVAAGGAASSLYHQIRTVYAPLLRAQAHGQAPRVEQAVRDLETDLGSALMDAGGGAGAELGPGEEASSILSPEDEYLYWVRVAGDAMRDPHERACAAEVHPLLEPFCRPLAARSDGSSGLEALGGEEVLGLLDDMEDGLSAVWCVRRGGDWVYSSRRMRSLIDAIGVVLEGHVQRCHERLNVWHAPFPDVDDALQLAVRVLSKWGHTVHMLTSLQWISGNHPHVFGAEVDLGPVRALQSRVEDVLALRSAHEEIGNLLSAQESSTLSTQEAFTAFEQLHPFHVGQFSEALWTAAKEEYGRNMGPVEQRISYKLKEVLTGTIFPALNASISQHGSRDAQPVAQPYQVFREIEKYSKLFSRPVVAATVGPEIQALLRHLETYLEVLRNEFERQINPDNLTGAVGRGGRRGDGAGVASGVASGGCQRMNKNVSPLVSTLGWVVQCERKVSATCRVFEALNCETSESTGEIVGGMCKDLLKDIKGQKRRLFEAWQEETQYHLEDIKIEKNGKLMDLDSQNGQVVLQYSDDLVSLLKETRQLTAMGFAVSDEIEQEIATAHKFYRYGMVLKQVANFYNDISTQMIPCQKPMLLEDAIEFEKVLTNPRDGMGKVITWSNPAALEGYVTRLQAVAHKLTEKNRTLRKWHKVFADKVCALIETDLVRRKDRWAATIKEMRSIFSSLELNFPKSSQSTWRLHWDCQIYKALEYQYRHGLEFLNESLPAIEVKLVFKHRKLQFEPPLEEIRASYYKSIKSFVSIPQVLKGVGPSSEKAGFFNPITYTSNAALGRVYERAEVLFSRLSDERRKLQDWVALGTVDLEEFVDESLDEVKDWELNFKILKQAQRESERIPSEVTVDCFTVSLLPVKAAIENHMKLLQEALLHSLRRTALAQKEEVENFVAEGQKIFEGNALSIEEIGNARKAAQGLISSVAFMNNLRRKIEEKNRLLRVVAQGGQAAHTVDISTLNNEWESFSNKLLQLENHLEEQKNILKLEIEKRVVAFRDKMQGFAARWEELKPKSASSGDPKLITSRLEDFAFSLEDLAGEAEKIKVDCEHFSIEEPQFPVLVEVTNDIQQTKVAWKRLNEFAEEKDEFASRDWISIRGKIYEFEDFLGKWSDKLKGTASKDPVALIILKEVESFRKCVPMLSFVRGDGWERTHWSQLFSLMAFPSKGADAVTLDNLNLGHFLSKANRLFSKADEVKALHAQAQGEVSIREALQQLEAWGLDREFSLLRHQLGDSAQHVALIKDWKETMADVADNQSLVQSLKDSPFYAPFKVEASTWESRLAVLSESLMNLNVIQRKWVYLEPIFARGALPNEQARFRRVDDEFKQVMGGIEGNPLLVHFADVPRITETLPQMQTQLEICQKALANFLEEKRSTFPRFYFIGDDDLLEILGQSKNAEVIQNHLKKLFSGIYNVQFGSESRDNIDAMKSAAGEIVALRKRVEVSDIVENWLRDMSGEMVRTLGALLTDCLSLKDYAKFPSQILSLADNVHFTQLCEQAIQNGTLSDLQGQLNEQLKEYVSADVRGHTVVRLKIQSLILDLLHNRDVAELLIRNGTTNCSDWTWSKQLRYYSPRDGQCVVKMVEAEFQYSFEYMGNAPKLVYTPLTDKCYLTLTQAMALGCGGNPFGPAGTGKTESVKALGQCLGRQVLVFNCDEEFDLKSMGRIFMGLMRCGAWGCFDEFNRLEEDVLSAVSQQIQTIQGALKEKSEIIQFMQRDVQVNMNAAIFVTLNPAGKGYGGRSKIPDNLKQLFRSVAMTSPDNELIAEVLLLSEGFAFAKDLSKKLVSLFTLSRQLLSAQQHYDWGLRALKTVLGIAGKQLLIQGDSKKDATVESESSIIIKAVRVTTLPKLTSEDVLRFDGLIKDIFPGVDLISLRDDELEQAIKESIVEMNFEVVPEQVEKILQLHMACVQRMGVIIVGPSGSGKSTLWRVLVAAYKKLPEYSTPKLHVINPKAVQRKQLLGHMDLDTREWFDGILTAAARQVVKEPTEQQSWIVCDGDIDPEWVESLNSVLDDNRLLTMPSGERIQFSSNVNFVFECQDLRFASPATVSRCGMIYMSEDNVDTDRILKSWIKRQASAAQGKLESWTKEYFHKALEWTLARQSVVDTTKAGVLNNALSHLEGADTRNAYAKGLAMGFGALMEEEAQREFVSRVSRWTGEAINIEQGSAPRGMDSLPSQVAESPLVFTPEVQKYVNIMSPWILQRQPFLVVGPEGCGKAMVINYCVSSQPRTAIVEINCSAQTTATNAVQKLMHVCSIANTNNGKVLRPKDSEYLVVFFRNLNLPKTDKYDTSQIIQFLQQLITYEGFYDTNLEFVRLEKIQIVASISPATTVGRHKLSQRFVANLRVLSMGYPSSGHLVQIYSDLLEGVRDSFSEHSAEWANADVPQLTRSIVHIFEHVRGSFSVDDHRHYRFTPRHMTEFVQSLSRYDFGSGMSIVQIVAYEACRIFRDRLVGAQSLSNFDAMLGSHLRSVWRTSPAQGVFVTWAGFQAVGGDSQGETPNLCHMEDGDFKQFVSQKLLAFEREYKELDITLFREVLVRLARFNRVLSRPRGSMLLIGKSGVGRRTGITLAAYMSHMAVVSPDISRKYDLKAFRNDLKSALVTAGVEGESLVFLMEDHQLIQTDFLECLNSLLCGGEIPGLFSNEELDSICLPLKEQQAQEGYKYKTLYSFFTARVKQNLHIVISMDPENSSYQSRCESNPALFTHCSVQWLDSWSADGMVAVARAQLQEAIEVSEEDNDGQIIEHIQWVHHANAALGATPRQYVSFMGMYKKIFLGKREELLKQRDHLQAGLNKLGEAEATVDTLSRKAEEQRVLLQHKQAQADKALQGITIAMQKASESKKEVEQLQTKLGREEQDLNVQKGSIEGELSEIQPQIDAAREAVSHIKKDNITELRSLKMPPDAIRDVLEGVLRIMGFSDLSWNAMRQFLGQRSIKDNIVNFDARQITPQIRASVQELLDARGSSFEHAVIYRVSVAAAPMAAWVKANLKFSIVLEKIAPLERDLGVLTESLLESREHMQRCEEDLRELDERVVELKQDFAKRTGEAEALKISVKRAMDTLEAAQNLLSKLSGEKGRWASQVDNLRKEIAGLPLNSLLAAGYTTYLSGETEVVRMQSLAQWTSYLGVSGFSFRNFMSSESETLTWKSEGLPGDDLSTENAIVILSCIRTPLIVDPSTHASKWLKNHISSRNDKAVEMVTLRDPRFTSQLELAVRFGKTFIVEEVDEIEPLFYPILRRDLARQGPRWTVQVGEKTVDYHNDFSLYLITRASAPTIPPDAASLITIANFTTTLSGLEGQLLGLTIQHEQPELEQQKSSLLRQEEDLKVQLAGLEKMLLQTLATSQGNILENKELLDSLNETKVKSNTISESLAESTRLQKSLDEQRRMYLPVAMRGSLMFFLLQDLSTINHMYRFSLSTFLKLFNRSLSHRAVSDGVAARVQALSATLLELVVQYVGRSIFKADRLSFGMYLAHKLEKMCPAEEWSYFLGQVLQQSRQSTPVPSWVPSDEAGAAYQALLSNFPGHGANWRTDDASVWSAWMSSPDCETAFPSGLGPNKLTLFHRLLLTQALRPDRLESAMTDFVCQALRIEGISPAPFSLRRLVLEESSCMEPVLFITTPGADPSQELEEFAHREIGADRFFQLPMGQGQTEIAMERLRSCIEKGDWLYLQNVHLAVTWLPELEKEIFAANPNPNFRLFLTSEPHDKFSASLLENSLKVTVEAPPGLKKNLARTYEAWSPDYVKQGSGLRAQLLFLLAWFHAVVQERRTYIPQGWTKFYEFSFSDLRSGADIIDLATRGGRKPQWSFLHGLLRDAIYGGKVDNPHDFRILRTYLEQFFCAEVVGQGGGRLRAVPGTRATVLPTSNHHPDYAALVKALPDGADDPALFHLPLNVSRAVQQMHSQAVLQQLKTLSLSLRTQQGFDKKVWSERLSPLILTWEKLMADHQHLRQPAGMDAPATGWPVDDFVALERKLAWELVQEVSGGLQGLARVLNGLDLLTPATQKLARALLADEVPEAWERLWEGPVTPLAYCGQLVAKAEAVERLHGLAARSQTLEADLDFGSLFRPRTFLNALRQQCARALRVPMGDLVQVTSWGSAPPGPGPIARVRGLSLQGGVFDGSRLTALAPNSPISNPLPLTAFSFVAGSTEAGRSGAVGKPGTIAVPVYLSGSREAFLTDIQLPCGESAARWVLAGLAAVCSTAQ